jgi:hypothetical protein
LHFVPLRRPPIFAGKRISAFGRNADQSGNRHYNVGIGGKLVSIGKASDKADAISQQNSSGDCGQWFTLS